MLFNVRCPKWRWVGDNCRMSENETIPDWTVYGCLKSRYVQILGEINLHYDTGPTGLLACPCRYYCLHRQTNRKIILLDGPCFLLLQLLCKHLRLNTKSPATYHWKQLTINNRRSNQQKGTFIGRPTIWLHWRQINHAPDLGHLLRRKNLPPG